MPLTKRPFEQYLVNLEARAAQLERQAQDIEANAAVTPNAMRARQLRTEAQVLRNISSFARRSA
jgi:hypothetical protein